MTTRRSLLASAAPAALAAQTPAGAHGLPKRKFGRADEQVSILGLGGAHLGRVGRADKNLALRMMHAAIDEGLTFFDNAWDYHDGWAEELMGLGLDPAHRKRVFLMTKNCERDYAGSMRNLDDSLRRLRTDYLDLWQFHEMVYDNDPDWVFEKGGMKAALEAQRAGKVRHIGFTGHKDPRIHLKMLGQPYAWASAQMPVNPVDAFFRSFQKEVVPLCTRQGVAVIGMKSLGGGATEGRLPSKTKLTAEQCVRWALSLPVTTLVRGYMSMEQMQADIRIARDFRPLSGAEKKEILALAAPEAGDGRHELFKTTQRFDGARHRRQHEFEL